nr:hypothetical protein [Tanacetum cinerariifolium]
MMAICNAEKLVAFKAARTSLQTEKMVSQGKNLELKLDIRSIQLLPNNLQCPAVWQQKPLVSTPVDTGMNKEDQQAAGGPTSLGVTSKEGVHPQLKSDMSAFSNLKPIYPASEIKLEDLEKVVPNVKANFKDLDSPEDDPIIVVDDSEEDDEEDKNE